MTVSDLRVLVSNLDEYIHIPGGIERLKKTVLQLAVSGQLVPQIPSEGTGEDLYNQIQAKYKPKIQFAEITEKDIPFNIPNSWHWVRLGNISDSNIGLTYSPGDVDSQGTAVLRSNNIQDGKMNYDELVFVKSDVPESKMANIGDLLICARNGSRRLVGKNALIEKGGMCFGAFMAILRSDFNKFIKLFLDSPEFRRKLDGVQTTTINQITQGLLNNFVFPLPPIDEQERIVEQTYKIFALIDELDKKYKAEEAERSRFVLSSLRALTQDKSTIVLDNFAQTIKTKADAVELRKAILQLAVSGQLVPQISSEGTGIDLYKQIKAGVLSGNKRNHFPEITEEEIPFQIPKYWESVRLGLLVWLEYGERSKGEKLNYLEAKYMRGSKDPQQKDEGIVIDKGQRVILVDGENSGEVFMSPERGYMGSTFKILGQTPYMSTEYIDIILTNLKQEMRENKVGIAIPHLDKKLFRNKVVGLPPLAEQERIVHRTTELLRLVSKLEKHLEK